MSDNAEDVAQGLAEQDVSWDDGNGHWLVTNRQGNKFEALGKGEEGDEDEGKLFAVRITVEEIDPEEILPEILGYYSDPERIERCQYIIDDIEEARG